MSGTGTARYLPSTHCAVYCLAGEELWSHPARHQALHDVQELKHPTPGILIHSTMTLEHIGRSPPWNKTICGVFKFNTRKLLCVFSEMFAAMKVLAVPCTKTPGQLAPHWIVCRRWVKHLEHKFIVVASMSLDQLPASGFIVVAYTNESKATKIWPAGKTENFAG